MLKLDDRWGANLPRSARGPRPGRLRSGWAALAGLMILISAFLLFSIRDRLWASSEDVVLSLQGSTSLGDELMPKLAAAFLRDDMGAVETGLKVAGRDAKGHARLLVLGQSPGTEQAAGHRSLRYGFRSRIRMPCRRVRRKVLRHRDVVTSN